MVSEASKKKAAQKKAAAAAAAKRGGKVAATSKVANKVADKVADRIADIQISDRTCTGVLCSHPLSRDIRDVGHESHGKEESCEASESSGPEKEDGK